MATLPVVTAKVISSALLATEARAKTAVIIGTMASGNTTSATITVTSTVPTSTTTGTMSGTYSTDITLSVPVRKGESSVLRSGQEIPSSRTVTVAETTNDTKPVTIQDTLSAPPIVKIWTQADIYSDTPPREVYGDGELTDALEQVLSHADPDTIILACLTDTAGASTDINSTIDNLLEDTSVSNYPFAELLVAGEASKTTAAALAAKSTALFDLGYPILFNASAELANNETKAAYISSLLEDYANARGRLALTVDAYYGTELRGGDMNTYPSVYLLLANKLRNSLEKNAGDQSISKNAVSAAAPLSVTDDNPYLTHSEVKQLIADNAQFVCLYKPIDTKVWFFAADLIRDTEVNLQQAGAMRVIYDAFYEIRKLRQARFNTTFDPAAVKKIFESEVNDTVLAPRIAKGQLLKEDSDGNKTEYIVKSTNDDGSLDGYARMVAPTYYTGEEIVFDSVKY